MSGELQVDIDALVSKRDGVLWQIALHLGEKVYKVYMESSRAMQSMHARAAEIASGRLEMDSVMLADAQLQVLVAEYRQLVADIRQARRR